MDSTAGSAEKKKKPAFQAKESPKCFYCGKSVFKLDEVCDAKNNVFHKDCLKCKQCKASLIGRQRIPEEDRRGPILTAQYLVAKEGTELGGKGGDLYCDKHAVKAGPDVVKAQVITEKSRDGKWVLL